MKVLRFLFSPVLMGLLLLIFAVSMAIATFIENDFGSQAAYNFVYDTRWFELILLLLAVNLTGQMIISGLYRKSKLTVFIFHLAFVLMIAGAAVTRYSGWEGTIHIREGEEQRKCFSADKYIGFSLKDKSGKILDHSYMKFPVTMDSPGDYRKGINVDGKEYELILDKIITNATAAVTDSPEGEALISLLVTDNNIRETIILKKGESGTFKGISIGFDPAEKTDIKITADSSAFNVRSIYPISILSMMTRQSVMVDTGTAVELRQMEILDVNNIRIVPQKLSFKGIVKPSSAPLDVQETGENVYVFKVNDGNNTIATIDLWDKGTETRVAGTSDIGGQTIEVFYGSMEKVLPFSLKLNDFVLDRYPGSNSPSGYKSEVVLIDEEGATGKPFVIFMNNILKYKGFRFYQSSYDPDEKGTILSVNHDPVGMTVTYTGYGLLFLFIILSLINRKSVFNNVKAGFWSSPLRKTVRLILLLLVLSGSGSIYAQKLIPDKKSAEDFGKILVQDQKGRTKPLFTLSNDILRKVARQNSFEGLTPVQVFLGIYLDFAHWKDVPLVKVSNKDLQRTLGIAGNLAAFSDIVDLEGGGSYKLSDAVNRVYSKSPGARSKLDKEIMKVDERINIVYMIYTGGFLKIFPRKNGQHDWDSPQEALKWASGKEDSIYVENVIPMFAGALRSDDHSTAAGIVQSIIDYQKKFAKYDLPPESQTKAEVLYYKLMIFERLFPFYATTGLVLLIVLIVTVIRGTKTGTEIIKSLGWMLFAGFLFHTLGLGLRWFISGHTPMSNGYESMIFISWVTLLAGFIFSRKSAFTLAATSMLASMTLMVAHLSFMDPEITNLVPVLKSYWLTLHVSVITGSYGFLGLGAILGIIIMILLSLSDQTNRERISATIDELTVINYKTITLGLYFLTIGTFLGAIWANESWGRYWGWDPKETWSLITIVVYTLVIHSRLIPGMKDIFTFNLLSLFAFSSVLMTYFGVNYYLSGLHSYAAGDPVPVPGFVYITVIVLVALSVMAYLKYRRWEKG
jgi:cytochrome c-type biogenesis protein CcsB